MSKVASSTVLAPREVLETETMLERIPSVKNARIITDVEGRLQEIHAIADATRNPKYIAKDFLQVIQKRWGINIDLRKVSIALCEDESPSQEDPPRLQIKGVSLHQEGSEVRALVTLYSARLTGVGEATSPASAAQPRKLVAEATLDAVSKFLREDCRFFLEGLHVQSLGEMRVMLTCVTIVSPNAEELPLVGACQIRKDEPDAVVRSTLAALNRRLGLIAYLR